MRVLTVNVGSSSVKLRLLGADDDVLATENVEAPAGEMLVALEERLRQYKNVDAVGHRVVHGGPDFRQAVVLNDAVQSKLAALTPLAPLHQPRSLAAVEAGRRALPDVPVVACFDTAFHATLPDAAATYALPSAWRERWPLRRFGFHGLSHAYAARRAAEMMLWRDHAELRLVVCHLGSGASLCAVHSGRSVDTTMGFTPLEGLVMATRSGSVDPGLVLWLITEGGLSADEVMTGLDSASGLAGLAGNADMRAVLAGRQAGEPAATLAFDVYIHRLVREIAAMTAALGELDGLVFTAGVGEHSAEVRAAVAERLAYLGAAVDDSLNTANSTEDRIISPTGSQRGADVAVMVIEAREDLEIARQTRDALAAPLKS